MRALACALAAALTLTACGNDDSRADELRVFAAASLTDVFDDIAKEFETEHPDVDVELVIAGSNELAGQILDGAPADVFAAADVAQMERVSTDAAVFARNRLAIVIPPDNPGGLASVEDLGDALVAVCASEVPCGALTDQVLGDLGADSQEPNVRSVLTKVELGEVDAGVVYLTDALAADGRVGVIDVPSTATNAYPIAALSTNGLAADFADFVASGPGQRVLATAGFEAP